MFDHCNIVMQNKSAIKLIYLEESRKMYQSEPPFSLTLIRILYLRLFHVISIMMRDDANATERRKMILPLELNLSHVSCAFKFKLRGPRFNPLLDKTIFVESIDFKIY